MQEAANLVAIILGLITLAESVRGVVAAPRDPARRAFFYLTLAVVVVSLVGNSNFYAAIGRALGVPNIGKLFLDSTALIMAWALQSWVLHWTHPAAEARVVARRLGWFLLVALVLLSCLFFLAPIDRETPLAVFLATYAHSPWIWCYSAVFTVAFGFAQASLVRMSRRYLALADTAMLRISLRFLLVGSVFGILVVLNKAVLLLTGAATWWPDQIITRVTQAGAFYCIGIGATCATWLPQLLRWLRSYGQYRRLFPLWWALRQAFPEIALESHPTPVGMLMRLSTFRTDRLLYRVTRLVTEINDGRLRLRPYLDDGSPDDPESEGRRIAAALAAYESGAARRPHAAAQTVGGTDLFAEITWLASVGRAWKHSRRSPAHAEPRRSGMTP